VLTFVKVITAHFTAKRSLEKYSISTGGSVAKVSLLNVECFKISIPAPSWPQLMQTIKEIFILDPNCSKDSEANKVIQVLTDRVGQCGQNGSSSFKLSRILSKFKQFLHASTGDSQIIFPVGLHCAALLGLLSTHYIDFLPLDGYTGLISACKVCLAQLFTLSYSHLFCRLYISQVLFQFPSCVVLFAQSS